MCCILPSFHTTTNCLIIATCSISMYLYVSSLQSFILVAVLYIWDHIFLHTIYHSKFVHKTSAWLVHSLHLKIISHFISVIFQCKSTIFLHWQTTTLSYGHIFSLPQNLPHISPYSLWEVCLLITPVSYRYLIGNLSCVIFLGWFLVTQIQKYGVVIFCILKDVFQESGNNHPLVKLIFH